MISTRLHFIPNPFRGRVAISSRPRGGDWLEGELFAWKALGVDTIVSLLESGEQSELGLDEEQEIARRYNLDFVRFPIPDRGVPASFSDSVVFIDRLGRQFESGKSIAIHCRQGIGRAGMIGASLLTLMNMEPSAAIELGSAAREVRVPETTEQCQWIESFAHRAVSKL